MNKNIKKLLSYMALGITGLGGLGVGIELLLSEILYPQIDEFTGCPMWYQVFMYICLGITTIGIILSAVFRRRAYTKIYELFIETGMGILGIFGLGFALARHESYIKDVIICIGGAFFFLAIFMGISTTIGLLIKEKEKN